MGDVHPLGNPHYWLDPENGRRIAQAMQAKLAQKDAGQRRRTTRSAPRTSIAG